MTKLSLALVRDFHNSSPPQNFIQVEEGPLSGKSRTVVPQVPLQLRRGGGIVVEKQDSGTPQHQKKEWVVPRIKMFLIGIFDCFIRGIIREKH